MYERRSRILILSIGLCLGLYLGAMGPVHAGTEPGTEPEQDRAPPAEPGQEFSPEIEALLNETTGDDGYGSLERCINVRSIRDTDVLDERHIVFELPSQKYYLVRFENDCHRLRRDVGIAYEPRGSQLCRLDFVRAIDNLSMGDIGPPCSIPGFYEVSVEQVALLKEALKAEHQAEVDAYRAEKARQKAQRKAEKKAAKAAREAQAAANAGQ